jgi:hypothetical protein
MGDGARRAVQHHDAGDELLRLRHEPDLVVPLVKELLSEIVEWSVGATALSPSGPLLSRDPVIRQITGEKRNA